MFPPKLTEEQKEHSKQASRSNAHVGNTWTLFNMYLQMDKSPEEALEKAKKAMEVWIPWEDENVIEYPDVDSPDMGQQFSEAMKGAAFAISENIRRAKEGDVVRAMNVDSTEVDTEFSTEVDPRSGLEVVRKGAKEG